MAGVDRQPEGEPPVSIAGIRLAGSSRVTFVDPGNIPLALGEPVRLSTERGTEVGRVVIEPRQIVASSFDGRLGNILGRASEDDLRQARLDAQEQSVAGTVGGLGGVPPSSGGTSPAGPGRLTSPALRLGQQVQTAHGAGYIRAMNLERRQVTIRLDTGEDLSVAFADIRDSNG